jgi:CubicO group peptidase (beta-lactamase class C family)
MFKLNRVIFTSVILILSILAGCGSSPKDLAAVDYTPLPGDDWEISSPEVEGLNPDMVAELYYDAAKLDSIYSLLIIKNDKLIAEKYFNDGSIDLKSNLQSATKSYTSALVGLAFDQGCLTSLDQPFLDFFPEYADQIEDPRKEEITIRHLLQMRGGYPWEESHPDLWKPFIAGDFLGMMVHFPLISDPGTEFHYSNVSSHYLGVIVERACDTDLRAFAEEQLFAPIGAELGEWWHTAMDDGYPMGCSSIHVNPRDAAKFGLLYLNDGIFDGKQVISSEWVHDSLHSYTNNPDDPHHNVGRNFNKIGYGYQWWTIQAGEHQYSLAYGHGGQQIVLLDEYNIVIVLLAYPYFLEHNSRAWRDEKANLNLVADFIASLPRE